MRVSPTSYVPELGRSHPRGGFTLCAWSDPQHADFPRIAALPETRASAIAELAERRPFVVQGLQAGTTARACWSFEHLRKCHGDRVVPVIPLERGLLSYSREAGIAYEPRRLDDVLDGLERTEGREPPWYVSVHPGPYFPGLLEEARRPLYAEGASWHASRIWIGTSDTFTPLHVELTDNVLCVLTGEKELVLYPPRARRALRAYPLWSGTPHLSRIDPRAAEVPNDLAALRPLRCTLREDEAIFIPRGWWHAVRTTSDSIAVNYWWARGVDALVPNAAEFYKRVFSIST